MLRFYTKFVVQRCTVCCDRRHLDKSTSDYIRNTGTQGLGSASAFWNRICVLKSHLRFEIASAFWSRICVLKSHLRFEIASAFWNRSCRSNAAAFSECDISSKYLKHAVFIVLISTLCCPSSRALSEWISISHTFPANELQGVHGFQAPFNSAECFLGRRFTAEVELSPARRS